MSKINISADIQAPLTLVWDGLTLPRHITQWNFADSSWECPAAENDLQVGGKFNYRMQAKDGSAGFDFSGTYLNIIPESLIEYTLDDDRLVLIKIEGEADGPVKVSYSFDAEEENPLEMQRAGWQSILDNFKKYVENL